MRLFSRYHLLLLLAVAPLLTEVVFWIRSYYGNDYIFCRWLKVTDEKGREVDFASRTPEEWQQHVGSKFQTRYLAVASRGGGVVFGLVLGRYVATDSEEAGFLPMLLQYHRMRANDGRAAGLVHTAWRKYPLSEDPQLYGFGYQNRLYTEAEDSAFNYRQHWAIVVPHWFVFLLMLLPTNRLFIRYIRKSRWQARGCCLKCGYDLRATPGECPECGTQSKSRPQ